MMELLVFQVYLVHAKPEHYLVRASGTMYDRADYYAHPDMYRSEFHDKVRCGSLLLKGTSFLKHSYVQIAPYLMLFLNGTGWAPGYPRLMTNEQLALALQKARQVGKARFESIGDISCDIEVLFAFSLRFMATG
jgi:alpha-aminoadipic semialdehyde synthase